MIAYLRTKGQYHFHLCSRTNTTTMALDMDTFHELASSVDIIESASLVYHSKYVEGVNLTYFNCSKKNFDPLTPVDPNKFRVASGTKMVCFCVNKVID